MKQFELLSHNLPSWREFERIFGDDEHSDRLVLAERYGDATPCLRCGQLVKVARRNVPRCMNCGLRLRSKAGTVLDYSKTSFRRWFETLWLSCMTSTPVNSTFLASFQGVSRVSATLVLQRVRDFQTQICAEAKFTGHKYAPVTIGAFRMKRVSKRRRNCCKSAYILAFEQAHCVKLVALSKKPATQSPTLVTKYCAPGSHVIIHESRKGWQLEDRSFRVEYAKCSKPLFQGEDPLLLHIRMNVARDLLTTRPYLKRGQLQGYLSQWELWHNFRQELGTLFAILVNRTIHPKLFNVPIYGASGHKSTAASLDNKSSTQGE